MKEYANEIQLKNKIYNENSKGIWKWKCELISKKTISENPKDVIKEINKKMYEKFPNKFQNDLPNIFANKLQKHLNG